ncbi:pyrroline-5-carboxylate reductase family protein [Roseovarius sp. 2305UL8-3]|uniref:pyrroline-5-carboxylate reductase family protein n=1 Tax=Roseovarius conchicola TaxID=3121636 RepID=UPI0035285417
MLELAGWLKGLETPTQFLTLDPHTKPSFEEISEDIFPGHKHQHFDTASKIPKFTAADAVVLATKPEMVADSLKSVREFIGPNSVLVSVAAGVSTDTIKRAISGEPAAVRIMPNIGAMVGHAVSAGYASENATACQKTLVAALFSSIGVFSWLDREDDLHAVTALSGSGPAYYFALCEAMIEAAQTLGLPDETSRNLAIGTVVAAGRLLEQTADPQHLRKTVTSPNGTTAAGLDAMTGGDALSSLVHATLSAARNRSIELA